MKARRHELRAALGFLLPNLLGFLTFTAGPVLFSLVVSFSNWHLHRTIPFQWIWAGNFLALLRDPQFSMYSLNTIYLMLGLPVAVAGSLALAILLSQRLRGIVVYRTLFYLPTFTAGVALMLLWKALYNPEFGAFNAVINRVLDFAHADQLARAFGAAGVSAPTWLLSTKNLWGLEAEHVRVWADYWRDADVRILGDPFVQTMARFFAFQLLQAASHHNVALGLSASIPAKTLSGPGYNGHVFWDTELYMLPFFSQQYPDIARSLLKYRIDRVEAARRNAAAVGAPGIKFPWQSADSGLEDTPKWIRSSVSGKIMRIVGGLRQIHINADVPMGFWQHYLATGDEDLLFGPALEILIQTTRYWAGRITRIESDGALRYEIRKVMGPDEYHECIDNSVYTNAVARWNLLKAIDVLARAAASHPDRHAAVVRKFRLTDAELRQWEKIAGRLKINFDPRTGLYEEFDGFFAAPRVIKQPDVLLMLHLLPQMRTTEIFRKNFDFYYPITDHGSSLSPCMHVLFALDVGCRKKAYDYLVQVCEVDGIRRGNKTDAGLHAAALGGGWTAIVAGFGGVRVAPGALRVAPDLPKKWKRLEFSLRYRGLRLRFRIEPRRLRITADRRGPAVVLDLLGRRCRIRPGGQIVRRLPPP